MSQLFQKSEIRLRMKQFGLNVAEKVRRPIRMFQILFDVFPVCRQSLKIDNRRRIFVHAVIIVKQQVVMGKKAVVVQLVGIFAEVVGFFGNQHHVGVHLDNTVGKTRCPERSRPE